MCHEPPRQDRLHAGAGDVNPGADQRPEHRGTRRGKGQGGGTGVALTRVDGRVVGGGRVSDHKGINLPGVAVSAPALTAKDPEDLRWALATGVDIVAMSFVRSPDDAIVARKIMNE